MSADIPAMSADDYRDVGLDDGLAEIGGCIVGPVFRAVTIDVESA